MISGFLGMVFNQKLISEIRKRSENKIGLYPSQ
jgi:hypothetical protein